MKMNKVTTRCNDDGKLEHMCKCTVGKNLQYSFSESSYLMLQGRQHEKIQNQFQRKTFVSRNSEVLRKYEVRFIQQKRVSFLHRQVDLHLVNVEFIIRNMFTDINIKMKTSVLASGLELQLLPNDCKVEFHICWHRPA